MRENLNYSIIKSVFFSGIASISGYLILILVARMYPQESTSEYLYIVTIGVLITLIFDFASEQSLVHHSKYRSLDIYGAWINLCKYKLLTIIFVVFNLLIFSYAADIKLPILTVFMVVPIFYMGPLFEYHSKNVLYAKIILFEKILFLSSILIITNITLNIFYPIFLYFITTLISLCCQYYFIKSFLENKSKYNSKFNFFKYINSYYSVYLILLSQVFYGNISRLIIDSKIGSIAFASITLSLQIVNAVSIVQSQVDRHSRPIVIDAIHDKKWSDLKKIVRRYIFTYLIPLAFVCILISMFSTQIIQILFGPKWTEAAAALRFASPLIVTIASMRFIDIVVVPLNATRMNLFVNIASAIFLFALLWFNQKQSIESYVFLIVLSQAVHVAFMSTYVYVRAGRIMRMLA
jgi:O-antigen/teichoic acid export membrane protein